MEGNKGSKGGLRTDGFKYIMFNIALAPRELRIQVTLASKNSQEDVIEGGAPQFLRSKVQKKARSKQAPKKRRKIKQKYQ